jgi:hypothetical protein
MKPSSHKRGEIVINRKLLMIPFTYTEAKESNELAGFEP